MCRGERCLHSMQTPGRAQQFGAYPPQGYPYTRPSTSFVFVTGANGACAHHELDNAAWRGAESPADFLDLYVGPAIPCGRSTAHAARAAAAAATLPAAASRTDLAADWAAAGGSGAAGAGGGQGGLLLREALRELHGIDVDALLPAGTLLTPILAIGSNAGPDQLVRCGSAGATASWRALEPRFASGAAVVMWLMHGAA